jgi:hypothetical protein
VGKTTGGRQMSKIVLECADVIDFLVKSYRARLEDDGEFIVDELKDNCNSLVQVSYDTDDDRIIIDVDVLQVKELQEELPKKLSRQIEEQLEEVQ